MLKEKVALITGSTSGIGLVTSDRRVKLLDVLDIKQMLYVELQSFSSKID